MKKSALLLFTLLGSISFSFSQTEQYVMFRVEGLVDVSADVNTDAYLRSQSGILSSRCDHFSETIFVQIDSSVLTEAQLSTMLETQGIHPVCSIAQDSGDNIRQKLQSKCFKSNSGVVHENQEKQ